MDVDDRQLLQNKINNMKILKTLTFLIVASFTTLSTQAQVSEQAKTMSHGTQNALILSLPDADDRMIEKLWKSYIKEYGKVKKNRKSKELYSNNAKIPSISGSTTVDIYATATDGQLIAYFDMGDAFLNSQAHGDSYKAAELFLTEFGHEVRREQIREEIKNEEKALKKLGSELSRLEKNKDGYHKDIERAKEKIAQAEASIEQNIIDQENKNTEIKLQEELVVKVQRKLEQVGQVEQVEQKIKVDPSNSDDDNEFREEH